MGSAPPVDSTALAYDLVTRQLRDELASIAGDARPYRVVGSTGRGNITPAPWLAIYDTAVTTTAQQGYYIAYLYSLDLLRVYAVIGLGVRWFEQSHGSNRRMLGHLAHARRHLADRLDIPARFGVGQIDLDAPRPTSLHGMYEHGAIVSIEYDLTDLPADNVLSSDLRTLLRLYDQLRVEVGAHVDEDEAVAGVDDGGGSEPKIVPFVPASRGRASDIVGSLRRSKAARTIGRRGEQLVLNYEKKRLAEGGRPDLADDVKWLDDLGEHPGYDILSFNVDATERWIEVKASTGPKITTVTLTENERRAAMETPAGGYWLYVVTNVFRKPEIMLIPDPVQLLAWDDENPRPVSWSLHLS